MCSCSRLSDSAEGQSWYRTVAGQRGQSWGGWGVCVCVFESVCVCVCLSVYMCCQVVSPGIQSKSIEDNFTAAHFQAFVFPAAATSDSRAPAATNFLPRSLFLLSPSICVCVCVRVQESQWLCVCLHLKSHIPPPDLQLVREKVTPYP